MTKVEGMIEELKKRAGFLEVCHKNAFRCLRNKEGGQAQAVLVEIYDAGPDVDPQRRYSCKAFADDGRLAAGNPAETVANALAAVPWRDLDRDQEQTPEKPATPRKPKPKKAK